MLEIKPHDKWNLKVPEKSQKIQLILSSVSHHFSNEDNKNSLSVCVCV
jgi:hypothetical protein